MALSRFSGEFNALTFAYGVNPQVPPLLVTNGPNVTGSGTLTLAFGAVATQDGTTFLPLNINAPILVGGNTVETVTPSAVSNSTPLVTGSSTITATFTNLHGNGDNVRSGTVGLQEAINFAVTYGGGVVIVDAAWVALGGTDAILAAAVLPLNNSVTISDNRGLSTKGPVYWSNRATSSTAISAPVAATSAMVASQVGVVGTWTAITEHVLFTYVNAVGGETLASADYSFTATVSLAIGGTGPAAATGVVGYKVYIGANATTTCYQVPTIAANGTVIQAGPTACFAIGTPFSVALVTTIAANLIPNTSSAFSTVLMQPTAILPPPFPNITGPYAVTGVVTAGSALEWGRVPLPTGYLNYIGRTIRVSFDGYYTPVSTATLIISLNLASVYGTTTTTLFTVTTPASSGTTAAVINGVINIETATAGATGTLECHGYLIYGGATGTAGLLVSAGDSVITVSSAADLTQQDFLSLTINSGTANLTQSQLRKLRIEVLA